MRAFDEPAVTKTVPPSATRPGPGRASPPTTALAGLQHQAGNTAVQRAVGGAAEGRSPVLDVVGHGGGLALAPDVREDMESRLGASFADVRIHTGGAAASSAAAVGAHAYTVGSDVVFGAGQFDTSSLAGKTMLAHELTHVVQQRSGPVSGTPTGDGVSVSDPSDRFEREAEATATQVMRSPAPSAAHAEHFAHRPKFDEDRFVQRTPQEDIDDGDSALGRGDAYAGQVRARLTTYHRIMTALADPRNESADTGAKMATGYRAWSENYYNKSQAYLFEAQKASERTRVGNFSPQTIAYLGVDTDLEPDLEFVEQTYRPRDPREPFPSYVLDSVTTTAVEMKASTSAKHASIDKLVAGGVQQLRKREIARPSRALYLEVHLDNSHATWPITDHIMSQDYQGQVQNVSPENYRARLRERMTAMKSTAGIQRGLRVAVQLSDGARFEVDV